MGHAPLKTVHTIEKEKRMKKLAAVFVTATFLLNAMAPTLTHAATYLQGKGVNAETLIQDAYVAVTYYDSKNKQKLEKGWIDAIGETSFTIRSGLWGKKTIAYGKVVSLVMSEEETTPRQINEVNQWFIGNIAERGIETEQAAIQLLNQKTVTIMPRGQIDPSEITKGWYAHVVYTSQGATEKATSQIADKDSSRIALKNGADTYNIAYNDIDTLIVAKRMQEIERYRETGAKYNARVRVYAPSIQKGQMVGRLIKMMQDTLVIQKGHRFYEVPVSSISTFDISIKQYRNTGKGLKIGLGAGAVIIGFTIISTYREKKRIDQKSGDTSISYYTLGIATLVGYSAGALVCILSTFIGAATKSDKWVEVSPQRLNLSLAPTPAKGLRAALTFNF